MKPILIATLLLIFTSAQAQTSAESWKPYTVKGDNFSVELLGAANPPLLQHKQSEPRSWKRYTVKGEDFSVKLPTLPAMTTTKHLIYELKKTQTVQMIGVYADGVVYTIEVYENTERLSLADFIEKQNERGRDPATERKIVLNDVAGREYKSTASAVRFFANQARLYRFGVANASADDVGAKQFFSSIVLGSKIEGIEVSDGPGSPFQPEAEETIISSKEADQRVRLAMKPEPTYTEQARMAQVTGTVILKVVFSASGSVVNIEVLASLPHGLTENAIEAARKIKFIPAVKNGKRVGTKIQLEYNFNLY